MLIFHSQASHHSSVALRTHSQQPNTEPLTAGTASGLSVRTPRSKGTHGWRRTLQHQQQAHRRLTPFFHLHFAPLVLVWEFCATCALPSGKSRACYFFSFSLSSPRVSPWRTRSLVLHLKGPRKGRTRTIPCRSG